MTSLSCLNLSYPSQPPQSLISGTLRIPANASMMHTYRLFVGVAELHFVSGRLRAVQEPDRFTYEKRKPCKRDVSSYLSKCKPLFIQKRQNVSLFSPQAFQITFTKYRRLLPPCKCLPHFWSCWSRPKLGWALFHSGNHAAHWTHHSESTNPNWLKQKLRLTWTSSWSLTYKCTIPTRRDWGCNQTPKEK